MRFLFFTAALAFATSVGLSSCSDNTSNTTATTTPQPDSAMVKEEVSITEEPVTYSADGVTMKGYVSYNSATQGKRPLVLVVPEWWGLNDYPRMRAKQLAQLGYVAMAVDMYGDGKIAADPTQAMTFATPFYKNPKLAKTRLDAALAKAKTLTQVDTAKTGAIGYCYGGYVVLNAAKQGSDLDGVVSFHGGLGGAPVNKNLLKAKLFVAHGGADSMVPPAEVAAFKKSMDSLGANYQFKVYPDATHAFTNPAATATGEKFGMPIRYNEAADKASWADMKAFFDGVFK